MPACTNCTEDLAYDGPRGRGVQDRAALLRDRDSGRVWPFCSPACRTWWLDVCGLSFLDPRELLVAEVSL